jgi:hypothetical protein
MYPKTIVIISFSVTEKALGPDTVDFKRFIFDQDHLLPLEINSAIPDMHNKCGLSSYSAIDHHQPVPF